LCPSWVKTRITQAERNRPSSDASDLTVPDSVATGVGEVIFSAVENGISIETVADAVFDAILAERFYILTDLAVLPMIQTRMEDILHQRQPTFFPIGA
jgi:hypothetical protein